MEILLFNIIVAFLLIHFIRHPYDKMEYVAAIAAAVVISLLCIAISHFTSYSDTEIWNGNVISKERDHGSYERPYDCFCTTSKDGYRSCQTCYETRYTVDWTAKTTVGNITFDSLDSSSRSVYLSSDPHAYSNCIVGEPAAIEHRYTNYIKASPDSIFNDTSIAETKGIPAYPRVHSFYKVNRVINLSKKVPQNETRKLGDNFSNALINLGPKKEVNIIAIVTDNPDSFYRNQVENAWLGGKKNDVVIFWSTAGWRDVMTFGKNIGNEFFNVNLKDDLTSLEKFDSDKISSIVVKNILKYYDRPKMSKFEYLKENVGIPMWLIIVSIIINIGVCLFLIVHFKSKGGFYR